MNKVLNVGTVYGITNSLKEVGDHIASQFVTDNYELLVLNAAKMGVDPHKCNDIVHDVYLSLFKAEENGEGYDANKGKKSDFITVDQFVFGRLKGYSRNAKYQKDSANSEEISASSTSSDVTELSGAQMAYEMAPSYDEIESIEIEMSIPEEIKYLLSFQSQLTMDIKFVLKNISKLARMDFEISIMGELRKAITSNADFAEALTDVVKFAGVHPAKYDTLVASL